MNPNQFRMALIGIFAWALGLAGLWIGETPTAILCILVGCLMIGASWAEDKP